MTTTMNTAAFAVLAMSPLLSAQSTTVNSPQDDAVQDRLTARLKTHVGRTMEAHDLEGMVVVIGVGDQILMEEGWGRLPGGRLAGPEMPVRAEPLVDPLVAIAALQLVGQGKLKLDEPIHERLEGMKWEGGEVQLHHLLGHTSGLIGWGTVLPPHKRGGADLASLMAIVKEQGLESTPGTCFAYSESNTLLLGAIVESVTEKPLAEWLTTSVLGRAGLEGSGFDVDDAPPARAESVGAREIAGELVPSPEGVHVFGEDAFCTTAHDLFALRKQLSAGGLLGEAELDALIGMRILEDGTPTGFGLGVNLTTLGDHAGLAVGGSAEGMSLHMAYYPDPQVTVIVMAADEEAPVLTMERNLARLVLDMPLPGIQDLEIGADEARAFIGSYQLGCTTYNVKWTDAGELTFSTGDFPAHVLRYQGQNRFVSSRDSDLRLEFIVEDGEKLAGRVVIDEHGRQTEAVRFHRR